jgi:D-alanyl-D-alanine carboxypeptidase
MMRTFNRVFDHLMKRLALGVPCAAIALAFAVSTQADANPALRSIDVIAQKLTREGKFSGVVLLAKDGEVVHERAYGKREERRPERVLLNTRFNLASGGKMFTAVAILQQVAAGRVSLDTTVGEVLTDYPNKRFASEVKIRHLLTHTAGAGDVAIFGVENKANRARASTVEQLLALHWDRDPAFPPGTQQAYGNFGHVVLGRMVEKLSGQRFDDYLKAYVFAPAGMHHTESLDCSRLPKDVAIGHTTVNARRIRNCATQPRRAFPAGGQISSARDMLRFVRALERGALIPQALFAEATRTHYEFMGLGFVATGYGPGIPETEFRWGHGGSSDGICTDVRTYPATKETVIVFSNRDAPVCFEVANALRRKAE